LKVDFQTLLYDPNYLIFGVEATITPRDSVTPHSVTVIDKTQGVEVVAGDSDMQTIRPAARVRMQNITAAGLTRAMLRRASFVMNGKNWRIESSQPLASPNGENEGELMLLLVEVQDDG
jgi:hypothetical protein